MIDWLEIIGGRKQRLRDFFIRAILWVLSGIYFCVICIRNELFRSGLKRISRVNIPVVSIGNLTTGGTGKTPAVMMLAKWFRNRGIRVAIISRGYGAGDDGLNDEAMEIETRFPDVPHLQNPDRVASALIAQDELEMQLLLLDDGFQHRRLNRDLDIVLVDATEPFGFNFLLPRGLLREPLSSLARAHVVIITRTDLVQPVAIREIESAIRKYNPSVPIIQSMHQPTQQGNAAFPSLTLEWLRGKNVVSFCAIGNPDAFFRTLEKCGAIVADRLVFPDHHRFTELDVEKIENLCKATPSAEACICTGKDMAKLEVERLGGVPIFALGIEMICSSGYENLERELEKIISRIEVIESEAGATEEIAAPRDEIQK